MEIALTDYINYSVIEGPLKILNIKVLHGANYFSAKPIVLIRLDLGIYNEVYTNQIEGFPEKLEKKLPSLNQHHCSEGKRGGFLFRVNEGTLLGHVAEHVAIELQTLAGMDVGYGKTRSTLDAGVYNIIFRFFDEIAGIYTGKAAVNLINSILTNQNFDCNKIIRELIDIREKRLLGPSTQAIVNEAEKRKIPFLRLDKYNLVQLGTGKYQKRVRATITSDTNLIAVETADDKYLSSLMLKDAGIPVPEIICAENIDDILDFFIKINKPIVIKPSEGYLGKGLSIGLNTIENITKAFNIAKEYDDVVIAQPHIEGKSYRLLVINYKYAAAVELIAPYIIGDGTSTIIQLIEKLNAEPERQCGDKGKLSKVEIDDVLENYICGKGYTFNSVINRGEYIYLYISGNMKLGGAAKDITEIVHPFNIFIAERVAKVIGLNVAGIDIIAEDISVPINENSGVVIEVNAAPDFRMHLTPTLGKSHNVAKNLVDMLFPAKTKTKVPIFSVTGTAGKTIAVSFLNYCLGKEGYTTGVTTSEGLYIGGKCIRVGDMTLPENVSLVLKDPTIDCAILETSREGILREGLGYTFADFGIVLNIHNEHIGKDDIKYIEDLAYAKSVVAEEVYQDGYTILNADNDLVLDIKNRIYSKLALFSKSDNNLEISNHILKGGLAVNIIDNSIYIHNKSKTEKIIDLIAIPLAFDNKAEFMYDVILASVTTLAAFEISNSKISEYIKSFIPDQENIPGRMNLIKKNNFNILLDNAHNSISFKGLKDFLAHFDNKKLGVIDAAGDRSDEEIIQLGQIAAETYDELFFYEGIDNRGRERGKITELLKKGAVEKGFDEQNISIYFEPYEAWDKALKWCNKDKMLVLLSARPQETINYINIYINK